MNPPSTLRLAGAAAFGALGAAGAAHADVPYASVLLQNDFFLGHDGGGYTNGLFFSRLRTPSPGDTQVEAPMLLRFAAPLLGLPEATLSASSLGQIMVTPRDIRRAQPDPNDAPYAGALVLRSAQVYVHDDVAEILAFNVGVIGPASGAAATQRAVHRLVGVDRPEGWDSQVGNKPLLGLERYRAWRVPMADARPGGASGDFVLLGGGGVSNLESSAGVSLVLRYGEGLAKSFPTVARLSVRTADPVLLGRGWFAFASLSADRLFNYVGVGSDASDEGSSRLRKLRTTAAVGFAYGGDRSSLSVSVQAANPVVTTSRRMQTYGSITYTYRLD